MLDSYNCPNCGAPAASAGAKNCTYCSTPFLIKSLNKISDATLGKYTDLYKKIQKDDPDYFLSQITLIAILLKRKLNSLAQQKVKNLIHEYPDDSNSYLWSALVEVVNHDVRKLRLATVKEIVVYLTNSYELADEDHKEDVLFVLQKLHQNYYKKNGVNPPHLMSELLDSFVPSENYSGLVKDLLENNNVNA